ncbi:MAG: hypothetical protein AAGH46_08130 [Bacteroidota bacterium]
MEIRRRRRASLSLGLKKNPHKMTISPSKVKVLKEKFISLIKSPKWYKLLVQGNQYGFEESLYKEMLGLYDSINEAMIDEVSQSKAFQMLQRKRAKELGLKKLVLRPVEIQLRTGTKVRYEDLYSKKVAKGYKGNRHLSHVLWKTDQKNGLAYQGLTCLLSVICPSFNLAKEVLRYMGVKANSDRVRSLSLSLGNACLQARSRVQLQAGESLAGKRVLIAMDGGRARTRLYPTGQQSGRNQPYETPWREPKLFVITTVDENGKANKETLPIYDSCFGDDETFDLLEQYLKGLEMDKARDIQFSGDGALWIWKRAKPMLMRLGVAESNITETLDFYHAMEHLEELKVYIDKEQQESIFKGLKQALFQGDLKKMQRLLKKGIPGVNLKEFGPYQYFTKNKKRIDYESLKKQNRPRGSGVIESGIRRIINLRFKCPSSFWYPENVEKLILMRSIVLSGRWTFMIQNILNFRT